MWRSVNRSPLLDLAPHKVVALGLQFGFQVGAFLPRRLDALPVPRLPVKGFAHVLPGHDLEHAADSGRRNVGPSGFGQFALYRLRCPPSRGCSSSASLRCKREILPQFQRSPLLAVAFALLPPLRLLPIPAAMSPVAFAACGFSPVPDAAVSVSGGMPRVLETAIFDAGNVGLAFGGKFGVQRVGDEFPQGFCKLRPGFAVVPLPRFSPKPFGRHSPRR